MDNSCFSSIVNSMCLIRQGADPQRPVSAVACAMKDWSRSGAASFHPCMITYILEGSYSDSNPSFQLKARDEAVAGVLTLARRQVDFDLYMGSVCLVEKWSANLYDSFEYNLDDSSLTAKNLVSCDSKRSIRSVSINPESIVPANFFDSIEADIEEIEEGSENEGASVTKSYTRSALLLWPSQNRMKSLGIANMVQWLKEDMQDLSIGKDKHVELASKLVRKCASPDNGDCMSAESCSSLLHILRCLDSVELISELLGIIAASLFHSSLIQHSQFSTEILAIGHQYGWKMLKLPLQTIFNKLTSSGNSIEKYCQFLLTLSKQPSSEAQRDVCGGLAHAVVKLLKKEVKSKRNDLPVEFCLLLQILANVGKVEMISEFLKHVISTSDLSSLVESSSFSDEIIAIGLAVGWDVLRSPLQTIFNELPSSAKLVEKYGKFLCRISQQPSDVQKDVCHGLANVVVNVLSGQNDGPYYDMFDFYNEHAKAKRSRALQEFLILLFKSLDVIQYDAQQISSFIQALMSKPERYPLVSMLVPVAENLYQSVKEGEEVSQSLMLLLSHFISSLAASSSQSLACPTDYSESDTLSCHCSDCVVVSRFLKHPKETRCEMNVGRARRYHLHCQLEDSQCPVTHDTEYGVLVVKKLRSKEYEDDQKRVKTEKEALSRLQFIQKTLSRFEAVMAAMSSNEPSAKRQRTVEQ